MVIIISDSIKFVSQEIYNSEGVLMITKQHVGLVYHIAKTFNRKDVFDDLVSESAASQLVRSGIKNIRMHMC